MTFTEESADSAEIPETAESPAGMTEEKEISGNSAAETEAVENSQGAAQEEETGGSSIETEEETGGSSIETEEESGGSSAGTEEEESGGSSEGTTQEESGAESAGTAQEEEAGAVSAGDVEEISEESSVLTMYAAETDAQDSVTSGNPYTVTFAVTAPGDSDSSVTIKDETDDAPKDISIDTSLTVSGNFAFAVEASEGYAVGTVKAEVTPSSGQPLAFELHNIGTVGYHYKLSDTEKNKVTAGETVEKQDLLTYIKANSISTFKITVELAAAKEGTLHWLKFTLDSGSELNIPMPKVYTYSQSGTKSQESYDEAKKGLNISDAVPNVGIALSGELFESFASYIDVTVTKKTSKADDVKVTVTEDKILYDEKEELYLLGGITDDTEVVISASLRKDAEVRKVTFKEADGEGLDYSVSITGDSRLLKDPKEDLESGETYSTLAGTKNSVKIIPEAEDGNSAAAIEKVVVAGTSYEVTYQESDNTLKPAAADGSFSFDIDFSDDKVPADLTVTVTLKEAYRVAFNSNGGTAVPTQWVKAGASGEAAKAEKPVDPTRNCTEAGKIYRFDGWHKVGEDEKAEAAEFDFDTTITGNITLKAAWVKAEEKAAAPTASPAAGISNINSTKKITLSCTTKDASIYYTTDGTDPEVIEQQPKGTTTLYNSTNRITITESTVIKAIAVKEGLTNSDIAEFEYLNGLEVRNFTFTLSADMTCWTKKVTVKAGTGSAMIPSAGEETSASVKVKDYVTVTVDKDSSASAGIEDGDYYVPVLTYWETDKDPVTIEPYKMGKTNFAYRIKGAEIANGASFTLSEKNDKRTILFKNDSDGLEMQCPNAKLAGGEKGEYVYAPSMTKSGAYLSVVVRRSKTTATDRSSYPVLTCTAGGVSSEIALYSASTSVWNYRLAMADSAEGAVYTLSQGSRTEEDSYKLTFHTTGLEDGKSIALSGDISGNVPAAGTDSAAYTVQWTENSAGLDFYIDAPEGYVVKRATINRGSIGGRYTSLRRKWLYDDEKGDMYCRLVYTAGMNPGPLTVDVVCGKEEQHTLSFKVKSGVTLGEITASDGSVLSLSDDGDVTVLNNQYISFRAAAADAKKGVRCLVDGESMANTSVEDGYYIFDLGQNYSNKEITLEAAAPYKVTFDIIGATVTDAGTWEEINDEAEFVILKGDEIEFEVSYQEGYILDVSSSAGKVTQIVDDAGDYYYTYAPTKDARITVYARKMAEYALSVKQAGALTDNAVTVVECSSYAEVDEETNKPVTVYQETVISPAGEEDEESDASAAPVFNISEARGKIGIRFSHKDAAYVTYTVTANGKTVSLDKTKNSDKSLAYPDVYMIGEITQDTEIIVTTKINSGKFHQLTINPANSNVTVTGDGLALADNLNPGTEDSEGIICKPREKTTVYVRKSSDEEETTDTVEVSVTPASGYQFSGEHPVSVKWSGKTGTINSDEVDSSEEETPDMTSSRTYTISFPAGASAYGKGTLTVGTAMKTLQYEKQITFRNAAHTIYKVTGGGSKISSTNNTYKMTKSNKTLKFDVTAETGYVPTVKIDSDGEEGEPLLYTKKKGSIYSYEIAASALEEGESPEQKYDDEGNEIAGSYEPIDKTITITDAEDPVSVFVKFNSDETEITSARIGAQEIQPADSTQDGLWKYSVLNGQSIIVSAAAKDGCKITKAEVKTGTAAPKKASIKAAGGNITIKATAECTATLTSEALYQANKIVESPTGKIIGLSGKVYKVNYGNKYTLSAKKGVSTKVSFRRAEITGSKDAGTKVDLEDSYKPLISIGEGDAGKKLTVKLYNDADNKLAVTYVLEVQKKIDKVTVTGVNASTLSQTADTEKAYAISISPSSVSKDVLGVRLADEASSKEALAGSSLDSVRIEGGKLVVTTGQTKEKSTKIELYNKETGASIVKGTPVFTIQTTEFAAPKTPTIKLASSDNTTLTFTVGTPNKTVIPANGHLYYKVTVAPKTEEAGLETKTVYVENTLGANTKQDIPVSVVSENTEKSYAFQADAQLIYTTEPIEGDTVSTEQVIAESGKKTITASTKKFAYEEDFKKALSVTKPKNLKVYTGQQNALVGTVNFNAGTTVREIDEELTCDVTTEYELDENGNKVYETDDDGNSTKVPVTNEIAVEQRLTVSCGDGKVYVTAGKETRIGTHKIEIVAKSSGQNEDSYGNPLVDDNDNNKPLYGKTTISVNVVRGIENLSISLPAEQIYKPADKTNGSFTVTAAYNASEEEDDEGNPIVKTPANKKVKWEIVNKDYSPLAEGSPLYKMVTISSKGAVTVNKNYVVSTDEEKATFRIKAAANDYTGGYVNDVTRIVYSAPIRISSEPIEIDRITIREDSGDEWELVAGYAYVFEIEKGEDYSDVARIYAYKKGASATEDEENSGRIPWRNLSVTFSRKDILSCYIDRGSTTEDDNISNDPGYVTFGMTGKEGTVTVTVKAGDGSGKSKSGKIKVKWLPQEEEEED